MDGGMEAKMMMLVSITAISWVVIALVAFLRKPH